MRILMIGGTRFIGRHVVSAALDRGHQVTIFHRGRTGADLFPDVEHRIGDRNEDLSALAAGEWDATVDTCAYYPRQVHELADALGGRGGRHLLVSSVSAYALSTNRGDYCISKAALGMVTQLWAARLAEHGIRVYEVRPGIIESDMTAGGRDKYDRLIAEGLTPIRRWGTAEDIGEAVAALVTGAVPFCTGEVLNIDGGFHIRRFPV